MLKILAQLYHLANYKLIHWKDDQCNYVTNLLYFRYSILAPNAIPQGFVEAKEASAKVLEALQLDNDKYKLGHTKVFFRAGVLGMLEELREERLSKILAYLQAHIRGYMMRRNYQNLQDQR